MRTIEEITEQMSALVAGAETAARSLSDEEVETYEGLEAELKAAQRTDEIRKRQAAYAAPAAVADILTVTGEIDETREREFETYLRTGRGDFPTYAQSVGTDSAGGFTAPEGFRTKITERMKAFGGLATVTEVITTADGNALPWPTLDDTANEGVISDEGAAPGSGGADLVFGENELLAFKYNATGTGNVPLRVSVELLQDSAFDVAGLVSRKMGERIARKQAKDYMTGAAGHTAAPQGLLSGTAAVELATANPITYAKLLDTIHAVDPDYRAESVWVFNDNTLRTVRGLEDDHGRPLWLPSAESGLEGLPGGMLLGHRVIIDQAAPNAANNVNFAAFGNMSEAYVIRRVRDVMVIVNPYARANEGQVEYNAIARSDGIVQNPNAYAILAGFDAL